MSEALASLTSAGVANSGVPVTFVLGLGPAWPGARCVGPIQTVLGVGGDNLALYRGLERCRPGDVLVADLGRSSDYGHWGDLLSRAALARGVAGLVIAGGIRDGEDIARLGFAVFHAGLCPRTAAKREPGEVGVALSGLADGPVQPGDLLVADGDGIAVVPRSVSRDDVLAAVRAVERRECGIAERIAAGDALADAFRMSQPL